MAQNATGTELQGEPLVAEMAPDDALLFLGSTAHGAGANHTQSEVRRGCVIGYSLGWLISAQINANSRRRGI